jgi:hypothetical protein
MVSIIILYYNIMGPPSYMRSVVDRNVVMRRITVNYTLYSGKHKNCVRYIQEVSGSNLEQTTGYPQIRICSTPISLLTFHKYSVHRCSHTTQPTTTIYEGGSKSFRPHQLFKVTEIKQLCYFSI